MNKYEHERSRPCNGCGVSCYGTLEIVGLLLLVLLLLLLDSDSHFYSTVEGKLWSGDNLIVFTHFLAGNLLWLLIINVCVILGVLKCSKIEAGFSTICYSVYKKFVIGCSD